MNFTAPMKVVLAFVLIVVIALGFWVLDWQKKMGEVKQLDISLQQKDEQYQKAQQMVADLPKELEKKEVLTKSLQSLIREQIAPEPLEVFVPAYLTSIEDLVITERTKMRDNSFSLMSITPGALVTSGGAAKPKVEGQPQQPEGGEVLKGYPTRTFQMSMKGKYTTLIDFLYQLGALKLKRLVTIERISLSPGESKPGQSPVLTINMPITAYLWQGGETK